VSTFERPRTCSGPYVIEPMTSTLPQVALNAIGLSTADALVLYDEDDVRSHHIARGGAHEKRSITRFKLNPKKPQRHWRCLRPMSDEERHRAAVADPMLPATEPLARAAGADRAGAAQEVELTQ